MESITSIGLLKLCVFKRFEIIKHLIAGDAAPLKIDFGKVTKHGVTVVLQTAYSVTRIPGELTC